MAIKIMKYNPAFLTDEELIESFVVRQADLELIINTVNENVTESNQHILVIGPRGSGKTTLVRRVAAEVKRKEELRDLWYPLIFAEESYEIITAGDFWLEALFHLGQQTKDDRWKLTYEELKNERDEKVLRERALAQLMDFADSQGKRILLVVENLNMLLQKQMSDDDAWALRHTLLNEPRIMFLATATPLFEKLENSGYPMFELFKIHELKPLNEKDCAAVWTSVTGLEPSDNRIRPLQILTGGNPRFLTIISNFGAQLSLKELMDELVHLVDDHTEYFKSQLDNLPAIERKVFLSLADLWDPATAKDIAKSGRLDVNKASSLLNRLMKRRLVNVYAEEKKVKWYQVAERLYNIYHLMRRRGAPADRVKAVVQFMINFYGDTELINVARLIAEEACNLSPDLCEEHYLFYREILSNVSSESLAKKIISSTPESFFNSTHASPLLKLFRVSEFLMSPDKDENRHEEILNACDEVINGYGEKIDFKSSMAVLISLLNKGIVLGEMGDHIGQLNLFNEIVDRYGERKEPQIARNVASVIYVKGIMLNEKEKYLDAIEAYNEVIRRFSERNELEIVMYVVNAFASKAIALINIGEHEKAILTSNEIIERFGDRKELGIEMLLARAFEYKLISLSESGKKEEAVATCEHMYKRFGERKEPEIELEVARAFYNLGGVLNEMGRYTKEIEAYDLVIEKIGDIKVPEIAEKVAISILRKGLALIRLGQREKAIILYENVIERYSEMEDPVISTQVASAFFNKGLVMKETGDEKEAEKMFHESINKKPDFFAAWYILISEQLQKPGHKHEAISLVNDFLVKNLRNADILNTLAYLFYKKAGEDFIEQAEKWVIEALSKEKNNAAFKHTLACILSAQGKGGEALEYTKEYLNDLDVIEKTLDDAVELFVELAATSKAREALDILIKSPSAKLLEPLIVGLKLYLEEDVKAATEIMEIAKDIVGKIKERQKKRSEKTNSELAATNM